MDDSETGGADVLGALTEIAGPVRSCIEIGTMEWEEGKSTCVAAEWFPGLVDHLRVDFLNGPGVDLVDDAHHLAQVGDDTFDAYLSRSVWEHMERPWLAAHAAYRVLRRGGVAFVDVPSAFPLHGYPSDFWRLSTDALRVVLVDAGFEVLATGYDTRADVVPRIDVPDWNVDAPAWLYAQALARKP
jgi:SAM-dependent methyltransferase